MSQPSYLHAQGLRSWLLTRDHKRIAVLYMLTVTFFSLPGAGGEPDPHRAGHAEGDLLTADGYNRAFTLHGVIMVWFS
jgi:Heme/copper-type cytochrome/quinol oxidases, subunit 1